MAMHTLVRDHINERGGEHALPSRPESGDDLGGDGDINQVSHTNQSAGSVKRGFPP